MSAQSGNLLNDNKTINYKNALNGLCKVNIRTSQFTEICAWCLFFILFISQLHQINYNAFNVTNH